jgi:hypothetical protein
MLRLLHILAIVLSVFLFMYLSPYVNPEGSGQRFVLTHLAPGPAHASVSEYMLRIGGDLITFNTNHRQIDPDLQHALYRDTPDGFSFERSTYQPHSPTGGTWYEKIGFHFYSFSSAPGAPRWTRTSITIPIWLILPFLTILPIRFYLRLHRRTKLPATACPKCHYDLRATDTGKCPECGTLFDKQKLTERKSTTIYQVKFDLPPHLDISSVPKERLAQIWDDTYREALKSHRFLNYQYLGYAFMLFAVVAYFPLTMVVRDYVAFILLFPILIIAAFFGLRFYARYSRRILTPLLVAALEKEPSAQKTVAPAQSAEATENT